MNIPVASDLRSELLVKLVKNWPEVSSRNIITWWQQIIFATQDNLINPLPYIPPYGKDFRATQLFKTPAKKEFAEKPVLEISLKDGVPNRYSRVWPLLHEEEFCLEGANLNRLRVRPKAEGIKATLSRASKWGKKKFSNSPAASTLKRNQLIRGSPLEKYLLTGSREFGFETDHYLLKSQNNRPQLLDVWQDDVLNQPSSYLCLTLALQLHISFCSGWYLSVENR